MIFFFIIDIIDIIFCIDLSIVIDYYRLLSEKT